LQILVQLSFVVLAAWSLVLIGRLAVWFITSGRYAVEALILNENDELLLYRHPLHKTMLPPGGRVRRTEFPNEAIQRRLQERLGLTPDKYVYDHHFHHGLVNSGNLGDVERLAAPFLVQRELHRQRNFVKLHYDFIYVLRLTGQHMTFDNPRYSPVHFADLETLREMVAQGRTLPDVLDAYRRALEVIAKARA
jgi:ADP-ribose pyrophosphatase YjhB (NUDIX family)